MSTITTIIEEKQRGLLYRDGRLVRWLEPGRHRFWAWRAEWRVERVDLEQGYSPSTPELRAVLPPDAGYEVVVEAGHVAVVTVDGTAIECLEPGRYILWQLRADVSATIYDTRELIADVPDDHAAIIPAHYMQQVFVADSQRAVLRVNSKLAGLLDAGRHYVWRKDRQVAVQHLSLDTGYLATDFMPEIASVLPKGAAEPLEVAEGEVALLYREGRVFSSLGPGSYLVWQLRHKLTHRVFSLAPLMTEIPEEAWPLISSGHMITRTVRPYERGLLWVDGEFREELGEGRYGVHCYRRDVELQVVDMREQELQIQGQEVMTADKVTLRLNLIVKFRVADARASVERQSDLHGAMYSEAQLVARSYIAGVKVDELLEARNEAAEALHAELAPRAREWGVEVLRIDLKDLILPGEMKTLLNRVIEAEKQAAANVIMRREETAATRAQANTAKMMENNPALMRLKELELIREVAENVGNITVVAGGDELLKLIR